MKEKRTMNLNNLEHCRSEKFKQWDDFRRLKRNEKFSLFFISSAIWALKMFFTGFFFAIGFGLGLMWLNIV